MSSTSVEAPRLRHTLIALVTWFAADTVAGLVILAVALVVMQQNGGVSAKQAAELLPGNFTFVTTTVTVSALVALSVLWRYARRGKLPSFSGFFPPVPFRLLLGAGLSGLIVMAVELALESGIKFGLGIPLPISTSEGAINPRTVPQLIAAFAGLAIVVPLLEEVLFRGYVFGWLKRVAPLWLAILLSAAVFAAVHGLYLARGGFSGWFGTAEIFVIGVLLAWWAQRSGSLRPGFVAHATINATSFALGFFLPAFYP